MLQMQNQSTFKRYELKFLLTRRQAAALRAAMDGHLALDGYGHSTIRNLYFDTETFRLVRRSIDKPVYKEKLRVRAYSKPAPQDPVFVELKKKYESVVYKRRISLPHSAAMAALTNGLPLPDDSQIGCEIETFRRFYGPQLLPAMHLTYEREAYAPVDGVDFRLTLDENILWRREHLNLAAGIWGTPLLTPDQILMELKTPGGIPLWMVRFLSENHIRQVSFSKYGAAYQQMLHNSEWTGGLLYA